MNYNIYLLFSDTIPLIKFCTHNRIVLSYIITLIYNNVCMHIYVVCICMHACVHACIHVYSSGLSYIITLIYNNRYFCVYVFNVFMCVNVCHWVSPVHRHSDLGFGAAALLVLTSSPLLGLSHVFEFGLFTRTELEYPKLRRTLGLFSALDCVRTCVLLQLGGKYLKSRL